jgi:hypothetical protein
MPDRILFPAAKRAYNDMFFTLATTFATFLNKAFKTKHGADTVRSALHAAAASVAGLSI